MLTQPNQAKPPVFQVISQRSALPEDPNFECEQYGIRAIKILSSGEMVEYIVYDLSTNFEKVRDFADKLQEHDGDPLTLKDFCEDFVFNEFLV